MLVLRMVLFREIISVFFLCVFFLCVLCASVVRVLCRKAMSWLGLQLQPEGLGQHSPGQLPGNENIEFS
jgi:hypothetical protein